MKIPISNQEDFKICVRYLKTAVHRHGIISVMKIIQSDKTIKIPSQRYSLLEVKALCKRCGTKLMLEALKAVAQEYQEIANRDYNLVAWANSTFTKSEGEEK